MLFCTPEYILFLLLVLLGVKLLSQKLKAQQLLLLFASNFFYGFWDLRFLFLLWLSIAVDFFSAILIERKPERKKLFVSLSVIVNLSLLGFFKYFGFFIESYQDILETLSIKQDPIYLTILLPVGISFYTFQSMAYTIDVYRGKQKACRDIIQFALFISFFPQLVAGPIERAADLLPQLAKGFSIKARNLVDGLWLILLGFIKKALVADLLAEFVVDPFFNKPPDSLCIIVAAYAFCLQLYCDFSGYVDIGRGSAKILGINLRENFNAPFFSPNLSQFWLRWHVTLSDWFRDYVFIPLGGSRKGSLRAAVNIMLTMTLCGFWHGASIKFVLWGIYCGAGQLVHRLMLWGKNEQKEIWVKEKGWAQQIVGILFTFCLAISATFVFRLESYEQAHHLLTVFRYYNFDLHYFSTPNLACFLGVATAIIIFDHIIKLRKERIAWESWPIVLQIAAGVAYGVCAAVVLLFGSVLSGREFVYFQF